LQVAHLGGPQTVSIGHQDHGRVAMAVAAMLAGAVLGRVSRRRNPPRPTGSVKQ